MHTIIPTIREVVSAPSAVSILSGTSGGATKPFTNTSASSNFTIPSYTGNAVLLVGTYGEGLPTNLTWNGGGGFTLLDSVTQGSRVAAVHKLDNPTATTANLTMTADSFDDLHFGHAAFEGMNATSTGATTTVTGSGTTSSIALTADLSDIVFASFSGSGGTVFSANLGTLVYNNTVGSVSGIVSWRIGQGGSTTISNTHGSLSWRAAAVVGESV